MVQTETSVQRDAERDRTTLARIEAASRTDPNQAIDLAIAALGDGLEHPLVLHLVAQGLEEDDRGEDALPLMLWAQSLAPADIFILNGLGLCFSNLGRWEEAMAAFDDALTINPAFVDALMNKGAALVALKHPERAKAVYERAASLVPSTPEPWSALAGLAARHGDTEGARDSAQKALALDAGLAAPQIAIIQAEVGERDFAKAETRARALLRHPTLLSQQRAQAFGLLADALDGLDHPSEAFSAYEQSNAQMVAEGQALLRRGAERAIDQARRLEAYFSAASPASWRGAPDSAPGTAPRIRGHVFLIGFPRSGTTLLEQVLAGHPDVVALEERPMLEIAGHGLIEDTAALQRLSDLSAADADAARRSYWENTAHFAEASLAGKIVVDKNPLGTLRLPVIAKLFPQAKILFARRDPRDVVLSCFRRRFRMNLSMFEFLSLDGAATYYDAVMRLSEAYFRALPLDLMEIRHEAFVADFETIATAVLRFVGLDWDPAVLGFAARARGANTPSAKQLAKGLNAEGVGQWRRYRREMQAVLATLEPWVDRFGYEPSGPSQAPAGPPLAARMQDIHRFVQAQDWPRVFSTVDQALADGFRDPFLYRVRGTRLQQENRLPEAIADFETALAGHPGDFAAMNALGLCLARFGRPAEGLAHLNAAVAIQPGFAPAHYNRGWTLEALGELAPAREAYLRALEIDPRHAQSLAALAVTASRAGQWPEARARATAALTLDPDQAPATIALAEAEAAQGQAAGAESRLRALVRSPRVPAHEQAVAWGSLGDVLDAMNRPIEAFEAYQASANGLGDLYGPGFAATGRESGSDLTQRLITYFETADPAKWSRPAFGDERRGVGRHVFLLGFPRSGTTMLGQALAGHPDVITLDEKNTLADTIEHFMGSAEDLDRLGSIEPAEAQHYRDLYWRRAMAAGAGASSKLIVDKLPTNTVALPLILKLFPDARIVFMRRDPRDVVLSCFRRQFVVNATTIDFLTLKGAARLYDRTMWLADIYRAKLDLDLRIQGYEALVNDFEAETRALCDFIDLEWTAGMRDFAGRAGSVATPSAVQISRGLNADGIGHWRRYAEQLAPVMPTLRPWIEDFGYPPT